MSSHVHSPHYFTQAAARLERAQSEYNDSRGRLQELERRQAECMKELFQVFCEAKGHLWIRLDRQLKEAQDPILVFYTLYVRGNSLLEYAQTHIQDPLVVDTLYFFMSDLLEACTEGSYFEQSTVIPRAHQILDGILNILDGDLSVDIEMLLFRINMLVYDMCAEFRNEAVDDQIERIDSAFQIEEQFQDLLRGDRPVTMEELLSLGDMMQRFQRNNQDRPLIARIESLFVTFAENKSSLEEAMLQHPKLKQEFLQARLYHKKIRTQANSI